MASASSAMSFDRSFDARVGEAIPVADGVVRITAPNASAYTFTGTNSFLLGHDRLALLDPGPDDPAHLPALVDDIGGRPLDPSPFQHPHRDHHPSDAPL